MDKNNGSPPKAALTQRASTGARGLDEILSGGLTRGRIYLLEGDPGTGKTTLALQFLLEGIRQGEPGLYVTLSETGEELRAVARSHGWSLDGVELFELIPPEANLPAGQYTIFHPSEVELGETTNLIFERVDKIKPLRVVFDSLSEIRLLARDSLRYRRQVLALKQFFSGRDTTVLLLDDRTTQSEDLQLHSVTHGVIRLEHLAIDYGAERRRLRVVKMRGTDFQGGFHDFKIRTGGVTIFPRLVAAEHHRPFRNELVSSGVAELDTLLGGGLNRGTSALLIGPAGVGKSSLAIRYVLTALNRGEHAALYTFDEGVNTLLHRATGLDMDLREYIASGRLTVEQVYAAELSPGEFAFRVRQRVDRHHAGVVVIDSLNSYLNAMPAEQFLVMQMHELLAYLNQQGVLSLLVMAQHGLLGHMQTPVDLSYLTDSVILLRYFECTGRVLKAISVMKKRTGQHEHTIREIRLSSDGVHVGPPLEQFQGILTGVPTYVGKPAPLLDPHANDGRS